MVLLLHRGELICTSPQQLRAASESEESLHYMLKVSDCVTTEKLEEILQDMKHYVDLTEQGVPPRRWSSTLSSRRQLIVILLMNKKRRLQATPPKGTTTWMTWSTR